MDKDSSHYTGDNESYTDKESKRQELGILNRSTPLRFACRINGNYYISYEESQFWAILLRSVAWIVVNVVIILVLGSMEHVGDTLKTVISYGLITQNVFYILLCFLDAGTVFEDEDDAHNQQRTLCMTCSIYKLRTSRHCIWCNKCAQKYDHHCSVFGKCIAKRNLLLFYLFIVLTGLEMPALIIALITNFFGSQPA